MNHDSELAHAAPLPRFTPKQGQYLAFIHAYTLVFGRPPAEADLRRIFSALPDRHRLQIIFLKQETGPDE